MDAATAHQLAIDLLHADNEADAIEVLRKAGLWDEPRAWRLFGDQEGNFATIGNQQSRPEAALVEKIVNSVDARLLNACRMAGIDPESAAAPQSIPDAVAKFFPGNGGATLQEWSAAARRKEAEQITMAATGARRNPCLTLVDRGEGQTPERVPTTFMSIGRSNKLRIPFVQGKFNMGGTGVLKFCGEERLQLIITRRNPALISEAERIADATVDNWSVTITRREKPGVGAGAVRNSIFTYLAPVGADTNPRKGCVLSFKADTLPLMPRFNEPYVREIEYGSAVKLFNYDMKGFSSNILMKDGLLFRLETLLPGIALPVNLHECREFGGTKEKSFVTPLAGLTVRLEEGKGGNIEPGFPDSQPFQVRGEKMAAKLYAFKDGRADTYRENEGVIFTINGQTHGALPKSLFNRKKVKMGRLADSLLVVVDCTGISVDAREDLFMTSRDRLSSHQLRKDVEAEIEEIIAKHPKLKQLANERRQSEIQDRLADTKPLEEVLESIFKSSPTLSALFLTGQRLSSPHNMLPNGSFGGNGNGSGNGVGQGTGTGTGGGAGPGPQQFVGRPHPTYFRFEKMKDGEQKARDCEFGRRCRLIFETDVENEYFRRPSNPGRVDVEVLEGPIEDRDVNYSMTLHDGRAHWSIELPDTVAIGQSVTLQCIVADDVNPAGFVNVVKLTVRPQSEHKRGRNGPPKSNTSGGSGGGERPAGIALPDVKRVKKDEWAKYGFDEKSSCKIVQENGDEADVYTFYVNVENLYLAHEQKAGGEPAELLEAKFVYGNVLIGLALIQDRVQREKAAKKSVASESSNGDENVSESVEEQVQRTTRALGPFIIPMINRLGALSAEEVATFGQAGDDE
jgi:hypothetical protein